MTRQSPDASQSSSPERAEPPLAVVTGGAGFIGSHLIKRLLAEGWRVISLDNYFTGSEENHHPGAEYRRGHTKDIAQHIPETPDIVFHLGEYSRVAPSLQEPEVVFDLNIVGSFGVFEFWRQKQCRLIYAGSSTKFTPPRSDGVAGRDLAPYTWAKAINTELAHNYGRWYGLSYSVVYFNNVYGPGERAGQFDRYGTVIETFLANHEAGRACVINGTGEQRRPFTHIDDTIDAIMLVAEKGGPNEYCISAQESYSLNEVARMIGCKVQYAPPTPTTRSAEPCDTSLLRTLGWLPRRSLPEYIARRLASGKGGKGV